MNFVVKEIYRKIIIIIIRKRCVENKGKERKGKEKSYICKALKETMRKFLIVVFLLIRNKHICIKFFISHYWCKKCFMGK